MMTQSQTKPVAEGLIALLTCLFLLFLAGPTLVGPPSVDANHPFDTKTTLERLSRILGDEAPHPVDSKASDAVIARLLTEIETLGFEPSVDDAFHCNESWGVICARVRNIGFWVTEPGPDAIMVASHHDSVSTGPGAADDGMGVVSSLEIARIMRARHRADPLPRPLYVLITDAEEVGLVGASRFIRHDPMSRLIGAVVSLEARGNQGIANMFETSEPNGRDLAALARFPGTLVKGPTSNSLAVDIYRAMPNGTDVTEYLKLDMDAANYAMVGRPSHYHTPLDDMEHLDPDAVFHLGVSALAGVNGFMSVDRNSPDTPKLYSDVLGLGVIAIPQWMAMPIMGLGVLLCAAALFRVDRTVSLWRIFLWPIAVLIAGGLTAWVSGWGIDAIRPETSFGAAYPIALRGLFLAAALAAGTLITRALYKPEGAIRHLAGVWAVMLILGIAGSLFMPGVATLFALPALLVVPGAILLILRQTFAARIVFILAAILLTCLILPMNALAETALFVENSAPLSVAVLWIFLASLPLMWRASGSAKRAGMCAAIVTAGFGIAALLVPAYTANIPLGLNILHLDSDRMDGSVFTVGTRQPVPEAMAAIAPFESVELGGYGSALYRATPAPRSPFAGGVISESWEGDGTLSLRLLARGADRIQLFAEGDAPNISSLSINGYPLQAQESFPGINCIGRSCRRLLIEVKLEDPQLDLSLSLTRYGLDETANELIAARPDWAVPQHRGDRRVVRTHVSLRRP